MTAGRRAALAAVIALLFGSVGNTMREAPAKASGASVPAFDHVFTVVMENKSYSKIASSTVAPYIHGLLSQGAVVTDNLAITHASLPNYLGLTDGVDYRSSASITKDCLPTTCPITDPNIVDLLAAAGRSWHAYMESMPTPCATATTSPYYPKHNPFVYYTDIASSCAANDVPYTQLGTDLQSTATTPDYAWITPNICNDMHDSCAPLNNPVAQGDTWLANNLPAIFASPAWTTQHSLLVLTWDEGGGGTAGEDCFSVADESCHVMTLLIGSQPGDVKAGYSSSVAYSHFSLLRTTEVALGLGTVGPGDAPAAPMLDLFGGAPDSTHIVQTAAASTGQPSASVVASLPQATTAGDLLVVAVAVQTDGADPVVNVTDAVGNPWARAGGWHAAAPGFAVELWAAAGSQPVGSVTVGFAVPATAAAQLLEVAGAPADVGTDSAIGQIGNGTAASSGAMTLGLTPDLAIGVTGEAGSTQSLTPSAPWWLSATGVTTTSATSSASVGVVTAYVVTSTPLTTSFRASASTAVSWGSGAVDLCCVASTVDGSIAGAVTDTTSGAPLAATVSYPGGSLATDPTTGDYTLTGVPPGTYDVTAVATAHASDTETVVVGNGDAAPRSFALVPVPATTITGVVSDAATGLPLNGASVSAGGLTVSTDLNGAYTLTGLPAGTYLVSASAAGYAPATASVTVGVDTPAQQPFALSRATVFSDGFESGDFRAWTTVVGLVTEQSVTHAGAWAAEGATSNGRTYAVATLPATFTDGYARVWFDVRSTTGKVTLLRLQTSGGTALATLALNAKHKLILTAGGKTTTSATTVSLGAFHSVQLHVTVAGTAGAVQTWLDGAQQAALSRTANLGTTPVGRLAIGESATKLTFDAVFDDAALTTSA